MFALATWENVSYFRERIEWVPKQIGLNLSQHEPNNDLIIHGRQVETIKFIQSKCWFHVNLTMFSIRL